MIDPKKLDTCKNACGIYFLFKKNKLLYIGKSKNILSRLGKHPVDYDKFSFIEVPPKKLSSEEAKYIRLHKPPLNIVIEKEKKRLRRDRPSFLGIHVSTHVKKWIKKEAEKEQRSVSSHVSHLLEELKRKENDK